MVPHPRAIVNLLLLRTSRADVMRWAVEAIRRGARCLLLLGYKGNRAEFAPSTSELSDVFRLLTLLGTRTGVTIATDDYTRRRLGLAHKCNDTHGRDRSIEPLASGYHSVHSPPSVAPSSPWQRR